MISLKKISILMVFSLLLTTTCRLFSQNSSDENFEIKYIYDDSGNFVYQIEFWDINSNQKLKTIKIEEVNPFGQLPYEKIKDIFIKYKLKDVVLSEINLSNSKLNIIDGIRKDLLLENNTANIFPTVYENNTKYAIIKFQLNIVIEESPIAYSTIVYIYNNKGEKVMAIDNIENPVGDINITENGYVGIPYEGKVDINFNQISSGGCLVYDLNSSDIRDYKSPDGYGWSYASSNNNLLIITYENSTSRLYKIYDFDEKVVYSKLYERNVFKKNALIDINKTGFVFSVDGIRSGKTKVDLFSKEFEKESLK